jgi:hypothetical protein
VDTIPWKNLAVTSRSVRRVPLAAHYGILFSDFPYFCTFTKNPQTLRPIMHQRGSRCPHELYDDILKPAVGPQAIIFPKTLKLTVNTIVKINLFKNKSFLTRG